MACHFAVFFSRAEPFQPIKFARTGIAQFVQRCGFFAKGPRFKPSATSPDINNSQWFTWKNRLEIRGGSPDGCIQIVWRDSNRVHPDSLNPLKDMARGMLVDAKVGGTDGLVQKIADATDAICVHADPATLTPEWRKMLDALRPFLAKRLKRPRL